MMYHCLPVVTKPSPPEVAEYPLKDVSYGAIDTEKEKTKKCDCDYYYKRCRDDLLARRPGHLVHFNPHFVKVLIQPARIGFDPLDPCAGARFRLIVRHCLCSQSFRP